MSRKYLIAGNWKMNTTSSDSVDLISEINSLVGQQTQVQVCICPPFTSLQKSSTLVEQTEVLLGAQNMSAEPSGAYTGEISAEMLRDLFVNFVILGHSERRQYFGETNTTVNLKAGRVQNNLNQFTALERPWRSGKQLSLDVIKTQVEEGLVIFP